MKTGRSLEALVKELDRQLESKKDFIAPKGKLEMVAINDEEEDGGGPRVEVMIPTNGHSTSHAITKIAHGHIGTAADIPAGYYNRMLASQPALLAKNVNTWFAANAGDRHMVRTLDGKMRALMSDKYKRIDHFDVAEVILPEFLGKEGVTLASCELTESRLYLKVVSDRVSGEVTAGDVVRGGFIVSNSEVGMGAVSVQPFLERLVCTNGMIASEFSQKRRHLGKQVQEEDLELYSDRTLELDMQAFFGKVRDTVRATMEQAKFDIILNKLRAATKVEIKKPEEVVELAQKRFNLSDTEKTGVYENLLRGSLMNLYGLSQAITRTAQDVESYDRATELESIGYKVITMDPRDVTRLN